MTRYEFLEELKRGLSRLSGEERDASVAYWSEMLEDRIESGMSEEEAVADVGDPAAIAHEILMDLSLPTLIKTKYMPKRTLRVWEIVLLALGSPIWLSLALAVVAVILSVYIVLWAVIACLWVSDLALVLGGGLGALTCVVAAFREAQFAGLLYGGMMLVGIGLGILLFFGCLKLTALFARLGVWILRAVKRAVIGKGK